MFRILKNSFLIVFTLVIIGFVPFTMFSIAMNVIDIAQAQSFNSHDSKMLVGGLISLLVEITLIQITIKILTE